jgi:hypothetical protein
MKERLTEVVQRLQTAWIVFKTGSHSPVAFPPGHFYSPIPSVPNVLYRESQVFATPQTLPGIDLNVEKQIRTLQAIVPACQNHPFSYSDSTTRFNCANENFGPGEAVIYFGLIGLLKPRRVFEVGSGYSTAALLDSLDQLGLSETECLCIEPYPELLRSLLKRGDEERIRVMKCELQDVPASVFAQLEANDILFIDSTHVLKTGSDVNWLLSELLPRLASGVYIHIHDMYYPFEYPKPWILQNRAWNEAYAVRAFLQFNHQFEICLFNSYVHQFHRDVIQQIPLASDYAGSGLWLRRV